MLERPGDARLLSRFEEEVAARVPHIDKVTGKVANPTPLADLTQVLLESAAAEFGIKISSRDVKVFGKFDSQIFGGSIKARAAVQIISEAIASGKLTQGQTVFEATSGNFGLALAAIARLGLRVVALVSRKLQPGVIDRLNAEGVSLVNLDIDICPAPGQEGSQDALVAKGVASSVRQQLGDLGMDRARFDGVRDEAEALLAKQDAIGLAALLARAYDGFCPEQYQNELNVRAHEEVTGPEIAQQLRELGLPPWDYDVVCAFGTGGTATGLSNYVLREGGRKAIRVVFPLSDQDVAGIRTKEKAVGLKFYRPGQYLSEHQVDFEKARRLQAYLNERGYDVGESGALVLYSCIELINYGAGNRFVALIADGSSKYSAPPPRRAPRSMEVTLQDAATQIGAYQAVVWTHGALVPKEKGVSAIASSLGADPSKVRIAKVRDIQSLLSGTGVPDVFGPPSVGGRILLVCMAGGTSLMVAKTLASKGITAESLAGGIAGIPTVKGLRPFDYLEPARE